MSKMIQLHGTLLACSLVALATGCSSTSHPRYYTAETTPSTTRYSYSGGAQSSPQSYSTQGSSATSQNATSQNATDQSGNTVIPLYQETVKVGTREVDAGSVRIRKVITTETVNQPVQVRRESLVVDRQPAGSQQTSQTGQASLQQSSAPGQAFQEQETVIQLKREEPVVETQVIQTGRVVAQKKSETQQQNVQRQIRREEIQVEKIGNPENVTISENLKSNTRQSDAAGGTGSGAGKSQGSGSRNQ